MYDLTGALNMLLPRELIIRNMLPRSGPFAYKTDEECTPEELAERIAWRENYRSEEADRMHHEALIENMIRENFGADGYDFFRDQNYGDC